MSRPLAAVLTLGCKLNLADSERIATRLRSTGYDVVDHVCEADAYVVNTCSVTHVADAKSRRLIRSVRRLAPSAAVAVTGCYPQSAGFDAVSELGADLVVGTRDREQAQLVEYLEARMASFEGRGSYSPALTENGGRPGHARAFIKAQEGCNDVCAFCIVPRTRGRESSRSIEAVAGEINAAVDSGAREAVVTGTQLGAWGRDLSPALSPSALIAGILERTEVARIRFSSLQPQDITPGLLALWHDPRLMPHFHLALQSGSDETLAGDAAALQYAQFRDAAARIRAAVPGRGDHDRCHRGLPGRIR